MTVDISLDSETWGKRAGFDARSLGGCVFDINTGIIGNMLPLFKDIGGIGAEFYVACENKLLGTYSSDHYTPRELDTLDYRLGGHRRYPLKRDPETVDWWHDKTSPEAQAAFAHAIDLREALISLTMWLQLMGVDREDECSARIWTHGAAFDPPIIEAWFYAVGLPVPWHYRSPRDTRTAFDFGEVGNHSAWMKQFRSGTFHHSLDDSKTQAGAIAGAWMNRRVNIAI